MQQGNYRHHYLAAARPAQMGSTTAAATATAATSSQQTARQLASQQAFTASPSDACNGLPILSPRQQAHRQPQVQPRSSSSANHSNSACCYRADAFAAEQSSTTFRAASGRQPQSKTNVGDSTADFSYWPPSSGANLSTKSTANSNQNNNNISIGAAPSCWPSKAQHHPKNSDAFNYHHQQQQQQQRYYQSQLGNCGQAKERNSPPNRYEDEHRQDTISPPSPNLNDAQVHYASQLRSSKLQHRFQPQSQMHQADEPSGAAGAQHENIAEKVAPNDIRPHQNSAPSRKSDESRPLHVNFNRTSRAGGERDAAAAGDEDDDAEEGGSRKKKYLTAKYGQQQMNLIKKRLKIEMWLYEQLKELTKDSKSEAELDEIDIDLDQLLDMDDDSTRRHWLQKTLEPFEDVETNRINEFIDQVLEQSRLL